MQKRKIFVSIDIPDKLGDTAEESINDFYSNPLARTAKRENMHITVVFCGYLADKELEKLKAAAEKIARETKKLKLIPKRKIGRAHV